MKPISPVIEGLQRAEVVYAKDQPQYIPLPALNAKPYVITRWRLSWRERIRILFFGDLWLTLLTFGDPLQPILLQTHSPEAELNLSTEENKEQFLKAQA